VAPALFWPFLFSALAMGLAAWSYPAAFPTRFTEPWLRNPAALKAVHCLALGQLALLFLAVSAQAFPVLFHRPHPAKFQGLAGPGLWLLGVLLLVCFLAGWRGAWLLGVAWSAMAAGWATLLGLALRASAGTGGRTKAFQGLASAFVYLGLQLLLGGAMAWGLLRPILPQEPLDSLRLHVHWGLWGFAASAIFGLLPKLLRLFQASTGYPGWLQRWAFMAVHAGLSLLLLQWLGALGGDAAAIAGGLFLAAAILFAMQLIVLLRAARSLKADSSLALQAAGVLFLVAAAALDAWLLAGHGDWHQEAAAVALGLGGFVSLVLLGTLQRIFAVLARFQRFYEASRSSAVPTAWQLIHPGLAWAVLPLQATAAAGLAWGLWRGDAGWIRASGWLGCLAQTATLGLAVGALTRGKAKPFPTGQNPFEAWALEQAQAEALLKAGAEA
jgi:hypothetical protein